MVKQSWLKLHPKDNLLVALQDLPAGMVIHSGENYLELPMAIRAKHKFAERAFATGDRLYLYGVLVGEALEAIPLGGLIHTGNVVHAAETCQAKQGEISWATPDVSRWQNRTFDGYHRADGSVGTANYCANQLSQLKQILWTST